MCGVVSQQITTLLNSTVQYHLPKSIVSVRNTGEIQHHFNCCRIIIIGPILDGVSWFLKKGFKKGVSLFRFGCCPGDESKTPILN